MLNCLGVGLIFVVVCFLCVQVLWVGRAVLFVTLMDYALLVGFTVDFGIRGVSLHFGLLDVLLVCWLLFVCLIVSLI